jgi:hypothetical protein
MRRISFVRELLVASVLLATPVLGADPNPPQPARAATDAMSLALPGTVQLQGWLGDKLDLCLNGRVWAQNPEALVAIIRNHNDKGDWRGEYWGKWYSAAVLAYAWQPTPERRAQLEQVALEVIKSQGPDGYLGSYDEKDRLTVWDIWCRKYVLLGLLAAYDLTADKTALEAARRDADNLIDNLERRKIKLVEVGVAELKGVANSAPATGSIWRSPSRLSPSGTRLIARRRRGFTCWKRRWQAPRRCRITPMQSCPALRGSANSTVPPGTASTWTRRCALARAFAGTNG